MSIEANKQLARRFFDERWNNQNLDVYDELLAPSLDIARAKEWARSEHATFGTMQLSILDLIADDDQVAVHWHVAATHQGDFLGVAATGTSVSYQGITLLRIVEGKIVDDNAYWDNLSILQQLGVTIPSAHTAG